MGTLKTTYLALKKETERMNPEAVFCVITRRGGYSALAPSKELLSDVKRLQKEYETKGLPEDQARWDAWDDSKYEERYLKRIRSNLLAQEKIQEIRDHLNSGRDVFLVCYEKDPPCHRFTLKDYLTLLRAGIDNKPQG